MSLLIISGERRLDEVRELFREYQAYLGLDLRFQSFEAELTALPGAYSTPEGGLFLASLSGQTVGCIAYRPLSQGVCELKRLFVRPSAQGQGVGRALCEYAMEEARRSGYRAMRLDTLARLDGAICLYRSLGFREIPAYHDVTPDESLVYMERPLTA